MRRTLAQAIAGIDAEPPAGALARADVVVFALSGLRARVGSGFDVHIERFRDALAPLFGDA